MSIGKNIKSLRESRGLTQDELGKIIGVSGKTISSWELETKTPRMGALQSLADFFQIKKSDIIEDDTNNIEADLYKTLSELCSQSKNVDVDTQKLLDNYSRLNASGRIEAQKRVSELTEIERYRQEEKSSIRIAARGNNNLQLTKEQIEELNKLPERIKDTKKDKNLY